MVVLLAGGELRPATLLDAETRLNPSLAAGYFGAGRGDRPAVTATAQPSAAAESPAGTAATAAAAAALAGLAPEARALADRQKVCPVTGLRLGSMGTPKRLVVAGRVLFLCCDGCEAKLLREPTKYLAKLPLP
jgi:hypothetical protein